MSTMITELYEALKEAGVSEEKSKAASQAIADYEERISKANISMRELDKKMEVGFANMETRISESYMSLVKWFAGMMIAQAGVIVALIKLL